MKQMLVAVLAFVLAGCASGDPPTDPASALKDADQAAAAVDVAPTSTTGIIRGVVVDEAIRPVVDVLIAVEGLDETKTTNEQGAFGFDGLPAGIYFLTASRDDYQAGRHSVEVLAGVSDPEPVRIVVVPIAREQPFIEALQIQMFVSGAVSAPVVGPYNNGVTGVLGMGDWSFLRDVQPNGTVAQFEFDWDPTSQLGETGQANVQSFREDRGIVEVGSVTGPSPLAARILATSDANGTAIYIAADLRAAASAGLPVGAMVNQQVDAFIHIFHNFLPNEGWLFVSDGEHPLPP